VVSSSSQDIDARDAEDIGGLAEGPIVPDEDVVFPHDEIPAADADADAAADAAAGDTPPATEGSTRPDGHAEDLRALTTTYPVTIRLEEAFTVGPDGIAVRPEGHLVVAVNPGGAPPQGGVAIESLPVGVTLDALIGVAVKAVLRGLPQQMAQAELDAVAVAKLAPRTAASVSARPPTTTGAKHPTPTIPPTPQASAPSRGVATGPSMMERAVALEKERAAGDMAAPLAHAGMSGALPSTPSIPALAPEAPAYTQASLFDVGA